MQELKPNTTRDQKRKMSKDERNAKILKMRKDGKQVLEIAEALGICKDTVSKVIRANAPKVDREAKIAEYKAKGLNVTEICKLLQISRTTYYNILKK